MVAMDYSVSLLKFLQACLVLIQGPLGGIAFSLSTWVTPLIMRAENPPSSQIAQFSETIARGAKYLQTSSRIVGLLMLLVTLLVSQHPDPEEAWKWKLYGATFLLIIQVGWYEVHFIFPINDKIVAMGEKLEGPEGRSLPEGERKKLHSLLLAWEYRHRLRIAAPLFGSIVSLLAIMI